MFAVRVQQHCRQFAPPSRLLISSFFIGRKAHELYIIYREWVCVGSHHHINEGISRSSHLPHERSNEFLRYIPCAVLGRDYRLRAFVVTSL